MLVNIYRDMAVSEALYILSIQFSWYLFSCATS